MVKTSVRRFVVAALVCVFMLTFVSWRVIAPGGFEQGKELHGRFLQNHRFLVGVNYPWLNYGGDFGGNAWGHQGLSEPANQAVVDADFAYLQSHGVKFVRWFVFCDGRSGLLYASDGTVTGLDAYVFKDMDTLVSLAAKHDIYLVLVLLDYNLFQTAQVASGVQAGGRPNLVVDPNQRKAFLELAFKPMLVRYGHNGHIIAWEVLNEPEWVMDMRGGKGANPPIKVDVMKNFVRQCAEYIHTYSAQSATIGSAYRRWVSMWTGLGLDFYQVHYYPWMEATHPLNFDADYIKVDKPVIIGEYPTTRSVWGIDHYLRLGLQNHYAGMFAWSLRAQDRYSDYFSHADEVVQWQKDNAPVLGP